MEEENKTAESQLAAETPKTNVREVRKLTEADVDPSDAPDEFKEAMRVIIRKNDLNGILICASSNKINMDTGKTKGLSPLFYIGSSGAKQRIVSKLIEHQTRNFNDILAEIFS